MPKEGEFFNVEKKGYLDNQYHFFQEIKLALDYGLDYGINVIGNKEYQIRLIDGNIATKIFNNNHQIHRESDLHGINCQYIAGFSVLDFLRLFDRPFLSFGLLVDLKALFSQNFSMLQTGIGLHERIFSFFTFGFAFGKKFITKDQIRDEKFTIVDNNYINNITVASKLNSGPYVNVQFGLNIPIMNSIDIYLNYNIEYHSAENTVGLWERNSIQLGITKIYTSLNK